jgi:hypothetical protein
VRRHPQGHRNCRESHVAAAVVGVNFAHLAATGTRSLNPIAMLVERSLNSIAMLVERVLGSSELMESFSLGTRPSVTKPLILQLAKTIAPRCHRGHGVQHAGGIAS